MSVTNKTGAMLVVMERIAPTVYPKAWLWGFSEEEQIQRVLSDALDKARCSLDPAYRRRTDVERRWHKSRLAALAGRAPGDFWRGAAS